jgi:uncharacterized membrane protein YccC
MDWYRGLRAGTALSTPLLIADFTGLPHLGWAALGGIEAIVTDAGGPYRIRLGRLSVLTLGGALGVFLGTLAGNSLAWALPVTLIFCFAWTYLTSLGQPFASASLLVNVIYACGLGEPDPSLHEALLRGGFLLIGGLWATILSLFLWPLDPYRPARGAISKCYGALASFVATTATFRGSLRNSSQSAQSDAWHRANLRHKIQLRRLIELAWDAVASVRAESQAETAQGRQLIVLLETVDLILERSVALAEHTVSLLEAPQATTSPALSGTAPSAEEIRALERLQYFSHSVAALLGRRTRLPGFHIPILHSRQKRNGRVLDRSALSRSALNRSALDLLRTELNHFAESLQTHDSDADAAFFALQCSEISSNLDTALETTEALLFGGDSPAFDIAETLDLPAARFKPGKWSIASVLNMLAAQWRPSSLVLRHAARVSLVCGFDVCLIQERHVGHGYWLILTSMIVLQPHVSGTLRKGLQRVGGTVGGGILAALMALVLHSQLVTGVVLFPFAMLALALLPVNYAAYAFFVTPAFVLAFLHHTGEWQLAFLRIANTIAGAAIAIAAMTVLFPSYERERIASYLRASLVANRRYLETLIAQWSATEPKTEPDSRDLPLARRATGLALNDMEESLERILAESWAQKASSENLLAFAAYMHRFSQTVTGLARLPELQDWRDSRAVQSRLAAVVERLIWLEANLSRSAATGSSPTEPWSGLGPEIRPESASAIASVEGLPGERQIRRLERQTLIMRRHLEVLRNQPWLL